MKHSDEGSEVRSHAAWVAWNSTEARDFLAARLNPEPTLEDKRRCDRELAELTQSCIASGLIDPDYLPDVDVEIDPHDKTKLNVKISFGPDEHGPPAS